MKIQVSVEVKTIGPELAQEYLAELWPKQRDKSEANINRLASDMLADRFHISPDAICRVKGQLMNGQNRLNAVVQCGKPQKFLYMESNDEELYKLIDTGLRRKAGDSLKGIQYANKLSGIARWVMAYDNDEIYQRAEKGSAGKKTRSLSALEIVEYCEQNAEVLSEAAHYVSALYIQSCLLSMSLGSALYVIGLRANKLDKVKDFLRMIYVEGGNNAAGDYRNKLIQNKGSKARLAAGYMFILALKSFNSFCNGTRPARMTLRDNESLPEI